MKNSEEFAVDFYFSDKILNQLQIADLQRIYKVSARSILQKINRNNYDLVIIGTAHRHFNIFKKITERFNTAIIIHNSNFAELSPLQLFKNVFKKDVSFRLKLLLKEGLLHAPEVYKKASHHLVLDESLVKNRQEFLPVFYNKFSERAKNKIPIVVIPGAVSQARRDYKMVLDQLKTFENPFEIVFLGKAKDKELSWLQDFEKEKPPNIQIKFFNEKVLQKEFDFWMDKADLLWCPIQKDTEFFSNEEVYGITKMTGNLGDAIVYGKKAVFPNDYPTEFSFVISQQKNIEKQFLKLLKEEDFNFNTAFSKEKISKDLCDLLRTLN